MSRVEKRNRARSTFCPKLAYGYPLGARVAQVGLIDILYSYMALMRRTEVDQNHARIAAALQKRPG